MESPFTQYHYESDLFASAPYSGQYYDEAAQYASTMTLDDAPMDDVMVKGEFDARSYLNTPQAPAVFNAGFQNDWLDNHEMDTTPRYTFLQPGAPAGGLSLSSTVYPSGELDFVPPYGYQPPAQFRYDDETQSLDGVTPRTSVSSAPGGEFRRFSYDLNHYRSPSEEQAVSEALKRIKARGTAQRELYVCPLPNCRRSYRRKGDLKVHVKKKHPEQVDLPDKISKPRSTRHGKTVLCPEPGCPCGFMRQRGLVRHYKKKHPEKFDTFMLTLSPRSSFSRASFSRASFSRSVASGDEDDDSDQSNHTGDSGQFSNFNHF